MYVNSACRVLGMVNRFKFVRPVFLLPVALRSFHLAVWVSDSGTWDAGPFLPSVGMWGISLSQSFQYGVDAYRDLASDVWPVFSCVRMLASFLGSGVMSLMNFPEHANGSVFFIRAY